MLEPGGQVGQSVSLLTVTHSGLLRAEVVAMFNADDLAAVDWVRHAEQVSGELWQTLAERRKCLSRC